MSTDSQQGTMNDNRKPNDVAGMDFVRPVDNKYLLITVDFLSRVQINVCKKVDRESVLGGLRRWAQECGPINCLMTDHGRHFVRNQVQSWCERGGINRRWSHVYDHRSHGLVERCNRSILENLRKVELAEGNDRWWHLVQQVERVMNGRYHQALGMTPYEAFYGTMQVHKNLVMRRGKQMEKQNGTRRMVVEPSGLFEGSRI